jgi:fructan beta-fructosidase
VEVKNISVNKIIDISKLTGKIGFPCKLDITANQLKDFSIVVSNSIGEELLVGYDSKLQQYFIDRTKAGKSDFNKDFAKRHFAPRLTDEKKMKISLVIDVSSIELFADDGLTVMTSIFFPNKPYTAMQIKSQDSLSIKKLLYSKLSSILK